MSHLTPEILFRIVSLLWVHLALVIMNCRALIGYKATGL